MSSSTLCIPCPNDCTAEPSKRIPRHPVKMASNKEAADHTKCSDCKAKSRPIDLLHMSSHVPLPSLSCLTAFQLPVASSPHCCSNLPLVIAVQCPAFLIVKPGQSVIRIQFILAGEHAIFSPHAIGRSVIAILNLSQRCGRLLPKAVIDSVEAIEPRVDIACVRIICAAVESPVDARLIRRHVHKA